MPASTATGMEMYAPAISTAMAAATPRRQPAVGGRLSPRVCSALQTLGLNPTPTGRWRRGAAAAIAVLIAGGYISIPVAVLAGVLR